MDFYYVNNRGERIDLSDYPYIFQQGDLLNWVYSYNTDNLVSRDITYGYKVAAKEIPVKLAVLCDYAIPFEQRKEAWEEAVDHLCEVISSDVIDNKNGKLYTDTEFYMECKIIGSEKSDWRMVLPIMFNTMNILSDRPVWITEAKRSFQRIVSGSGESEEFLDYEHDYNYDYTMPYGGDVIWKVDHYAPCEYEMIIYGPGVDPRVVINGHIYQVYATLDENDYLKINSRENSVVKYLANGTQRDLYDYRVKITGSLFEPIMPGNVQVVWSGEFGFDLTLFCERSEPRWGNGISENPGDQPSNGTGDGGETAGLQLKTGRTSSASIDTGLSSIIAFGIAAMSAATGVGLCNAMFNSYEDADHVNMSYCSSSSDYLKMYAYTASSSYFSISGGVFEWTGTGNYALQEGMEYQWFAIGT